MILRKLKFLLLLYPSLRVLVLRNAMTDVAMRMRAGSISTRRISNRNGKNTIALGRDPRYARYTSFCGHELRKLIRF